LKKTSGTRIFAAKIPLEFSLSVTKCHAPRFRILFVFPPFLIRVGALRDPGSTIVLNGALSRPLSIALAEEENVPLSEEERLEAAISTENNWAGFHYGGNSGDRCVSFSDHEFETFQQNVRRNPTRTSL
jgi:hypothetical protein